MIELEDILAFIAGHDSAAARKVRQRIEQACRRLALFPASGIAADEAGTHVLPIVRYPYMIYYAIDEMRDEVVVLHIRHTARKKPAADDPRAG